MDAVEEIRAVCEARLKELRDEESKIVRAVEILAPHSEQKVGTPLEAVTPATFPPIQKRRGRPPGSKSKKTTRRKATTTHPVAA